MMIWPMFVPVGIQFASLVVVIVYDIIYARGLEKQSERRQRHRPVQADSFFDPGQGYDPETWRSYGQIGRDGRLPPILLKTSLLPAPHVSAPDPILGPFMGALTGHYREFPCNFCPEVSSRPCFTIANSSQFYLQAEGRFCKTISYCVAAFGLFSHEGSLGRFLNYYVRSYTEDWQFCVMDSEKCYALGSIESRRAKSGLIEPDYGDHLSHGIALNITAIWSEHPKMGRGEEERKSEREGPTGRRRRIAGEDGDEKIHGKQGYNRAVETSATVKPRHTPKPGKFCNGSCKFHPRLLHENSAWKLKRKTSKTGRKSSRKKCTACSRYYWLRKITILLPTVLLILSSPIHAWIFVIYYRKTQHFEWWLRVQFVYVLLNYTALVWICVFLICNYHPDKELMFLACMQLLFQFVIFLNSIACLCLAKYSIINSEPTQ